MVNKTETVKRRLQEAVDVNPEKSKPLYVSKSLFEASKIRILYHMLQLAIHLS
jgi:hypothetical protein